jgi:hypothetical protein
MGKGVKHYFKDGTTHKGAYHKHKGAYHKHPDGKLMTGKTMSKSSKVIYHYKDLSDKAKKKAKESWR